MKKTIIFSTELNHETVEELITKIEDIVDKFPTYTIELYFSSTGGLSSATHILSDFLKSHEDRIVLIAVDCIGSNGFNLFYDYQGEKRLLADVIGIIHLISFTPESRNIQYKYSIDSVQWKEVQDINLSYLNKYKHFLTKSEQKRFMEGESIVLSSERMYQLFN